MSDSDTDEIVTVPRPSYIHNITKPSRTMSFSKDVVKELEPDLQAEEIVSLPLPEVAIVPIPIEDSVEEKIRTYLRIRPTKNTGYSTLFVRKDEKTLAVNSLVTVNGRRVPNDKNETMFTFTKVLGPESTQIQIFEECVSSILEKLYAGESCLIFGYGATNSGKTHTLQGYGNDFGIVPRTMECLFNQLEDKLYHRGNVKPHMFNQFISLNDKEVISLLEIKNKILRESKSKLSDVDMGSFTSSLRPSLSGSVISNGSTEATNNMHTSIINSMPVLLGEKIDIPDDATLYSLWVSFAELYNEKVYDLFEMSPSKKRKEMKLMADKAGRVYIKDLTEVCATSAEEAYKLFLAGKANLRYAATGMNANSSRSHCFFSIRVVTVGTTRGNIYPKQVHRLCFCDLAGAERASQTGNIGNRLKESGNINQSLLVLLRCIRAMRDIQAKKTASTDFVPFRESKLARLFQSYLTTASHISMIVNINPDPKNFESTFQVLHNSAIASQVITFKKVEPPSNDTKFYRKVRESISNAQSMTEKLTNAVAQKVKKVDEGRYVCNTVIAKPKLVTKGVELTSAQVEINHLQRENQSLKISLADRIDEVSRLRKFMDAVAQQDEESAIKAERYHRACEAISGKRLSLQARILNSDHQKEIALLKQQLKAQTETGAPESEDYETLSSSDEEEAPEFHSSDPYKTPKPISVSKSLFMKNQKITELTEANEELAEIVNALRYSLDEQNQKIIATSLEYKEKEEMYQEIIEHQRIIVKRLEDEMANLSINDPTIRDEEICSQLMELNQENKRLVEENEVLKQELNDGQTTCVEYDKKLQEANETIGKLNDALNVAMEVERKNKEELDIIHFSYEYMQNELQKYEEIKKGLKVEKKSTGTRTSPTLYSRCMDDMGRSKRGGIYRRTSYSKGVTKTKSNETVYSSDMSHLSGGSEGLRPFRISE